MDKPIGGPTIKKKEGRRREAGPERKERFCWVKEPAMIRPALRVRGFQKTVKLGKAKKGRVSAKHTTKQPARHSSEKNK